MQLDTLRLNESACVTETQRTHVIPQTGLSPERLMRRLITPCQDPDIPLLTPPNFPSPKTSSQTSTQTAVRTNHTRQRMSHSLAMCMWGPAAQLSPKIRGQTRF